jgi:EAL and modified HD-GYP domain-containing signal transduction protein
MPWCKSYRSSTSSVEAGGGPQRNMTSSVLGSVTLGFEPIWNQKRQCTAVRLFAAPLNSTGVDARHLLEAIASVWPGTAPTLLLNVQSPDLLCDLLDQPHARGVWLEVADTWLSDTALTERVQQAHQRGWPIVWSGPAGHAPPPHSTAWFQKTLRSLTPQEALRTLHAIQHPTSPSPVLAGCLYQGLASQALVDHALDRQSIWGVVGWPVDEILHVHRFRQIQPSRQHIRALLKAQESDASLETVEQLLSEEPLLTYRFLRYANSAHLGARREVNTIRQGLMVMGYTQLRTWLMEQIATGNDDLDLVPIRASMVLRGRLMEHLCEAGIENELRREVYLCGIFSQLDLLLGEPIGAAIQRLPLPGRITSALIGQTGPYTAWLTVATALESGNTRMIREVCNAHKISANDVNRALLHALAAL